MSDTIKKYFEDKENHEFMEKHFYKGDMWAKYKVPPPNVNQNYIWEDKTLNVIGYYLAPMTDSERGRTLKSQLEISQIKFAGHDVMNIMCADIIEYIKEDIQRELDE